MSDESPTGAGVGPRGETLLGDAWRRFRRNRLALVGLVIVGTLLTAALLAPWAAPYDPGKQSLIEKRARPGGKYVLGADEFGRDILSRVIYGTRVALFVGTMSVVIALALGFTVGSVAGFVGGWVDAMLMRAVEVLLAFPYLLLAIAVVSALGPGTLNTTIAVGIWGAPPVSRIVRASVLALKETEYVRAARALGASNLTLIGRHILPNMLPTVIVYGTLFMANAILVEAALSFLGLGVQPPTPSWGLMVSTGRDFLLVAPHITTIPGLAIMLTVLGFNLLGDGLRDALDPAASGERVTAGGLDGAVALVSGGAHGIGRAIALELGRAGAEVWVCDVLDAEVAETGRVVTEATGRSCHVRVVDVTESRRVETFVAEAAERGGRVDVLVNTAGGVAGQTMRPLEEVPDEDWRRIFAINLDGAFHLTRAVAPIMKARRRGSIVNISSGAGRSHSLTGIQAYASAKAGLIGLTRQTARELGPYGIRVNCVAPGFVRSNPATERQWQAMGEAGQRRLLDSIALGRIGQPEEIARVVRFFASDDAAYVTGQTISADGGHWMLG